MSRRSFLPALCVLVGVWPALAAEGSDPAGDEFFERRVRPLLVEHCYSCHAKGQKKGGLSLENRAGMLAGGENGTALAPNKPADSLLLKAVQYSDDLQMPPNGKLADQEVAIFKEWVERGAPWPDSKRDASGLRTPGAVTDADRQFWSFQPVRPQPLPQVSDTNWPRQPIDAYLLATLDKQQLKPVAEAAPRTLVRRATFDLTGLPPTPDEVESFLTDSSPDAYERLTDRLLASPSYGERWSRHWLDIARYAEDQAHTFAARTYPSGYRYRDWVVDAFNTDLPYNRFVLEQVAGDLLPDGEANPRVTALGFFALGPVYYADAGCAPKALADELDDRVDTLCRGLLGLTVSCARCHDHKFDPLTMRDYYALAGVFASTKYVEAPLVPPDVVQKYEAAVNRMKEQEKAVAAVQNDAMREIRESLAPQLSGYVVAAWKLQTGRKSDAKLAAGPIAKEAGLHDFVVEAWAKTLAENLEKKSYLAGIKTAVANSDSTEALAALEIATAGLQTKLLVALEERRTQNAKYAEAIAAAPAEGKDKVVKPQLEKPQAELLKDLLDDGKAPFAIPADRIEKLASEERRVQIATAKQELEQRKGQVGPKYPIAHSLADAEPKNLKLHLRGDHKQLGDEAPRRFVEVLTNGEPAVFSQGSGRLELAQQIASNQNPLTARVLVNRIWQHHFGRGIVGTPSNFGLLGERPTHPELLDDLASRFMQTGWSLKWLHRQIMSAAVYRLSSDIESTQQEHDADNRLLWRMNRRRLDIEAWRDAVLFTSGNLNQQLGGPSLDLNSGDNRRRTLYAVVSRHNLNPTLRLFDFPDPNLTSERRVSTTVPMQQLFVMNSEAIVRESRSLAGRLQRKSAENDTVRIAHAYQILFGRPPTEREQQLGIEFLQVASGAEAKLTAWERYAQALLGTNEFVFVD